MRYTGFLSILMVFFFSINSAYAGDGIEKVNIYTGHFLLQSWPQDKRVINIDIDTLLPPDTLVFQAKASAGGLKKATLELRDIRGNVIEFVSRVTRLEDETEATFIYVLNPANTRKIKDQRFRVVLDSHHPSPEDGIHNIALVFLHYSR